MRAPVQAGFASDSTIWVSDPGLFRLSWFHREGAFLHSEPAQPIPIPGGPWRAQPRVVLEGGTVLGITYMPDGQAGDSFPVAFWGSDGTFRILDWLPWGPDRGGTVRNRQGLPLQVPSPFQGDPLLLSPAIGGGFSVLDRSPASGPQGQITVQRFSADGEQRGTVGIPYRATPVSDSLRDWARAHAAVYLEVMRQMSPGVQVVSEAQMRDAIWIPEYLPPVFSAFEDPEGYWLVREIGRHPRVIERYTLQGQAVGALPVPVEASLILGASSTALLGISFDSLRVPMAHLLAVTWVQDP
jgi:hypothetical protein